MLSTILLAAVAANGVLAALIDVRQPWPYSGPLRVDPGTGERGIMTGVNRCTNSTQDSLCVNAVVNSILDFCIYAPPAPMWFLKLAGNSPKYNTRVIPSGAITGMLVVKTPGYLAIAANLNGPLLNIQAGDTGGELDPHGNPIGALMYSNAFSGSATGETQMSEWHEFVSSDTVCLKVCTDPTPGKLCENRFDTFGCNVNVPLDYASIGQSYRQCLGDNQLPPAQNMGGSIFTPPISSCTTYSSAQIFANAPAASSSASASASASGSRSGSASAPTSTPSRTATASISSSSSAGAALPTRAPAQGLAAALAVAAFALV